MAKKFAMYENVIPLLAPQDITSTATPTPFVDLKLAKSATFVLFFGSITAISADESVTVTVEAATAAASGSEAAITFKYRLSGAVGANTWGAVTDATVAGVAVATTDDNKMLLIELDPGTVQNEKADARWVRVVVTPDAEGSATLVSGYVELDPTYRQTTMDSAT